MSSLAIMAPESERRVIECSDLKKCGEITAKLTMHNKEYFLNCDFCDFSFLLLENFMQHIYEDHFIEFYDSEDNRNGEGGTSPKGKQIYDTANTTSLDDGLRDFEQVEIELDTSEMESSTDIEEEAITPNLPDDNNGTLEVPEDTELKVSPFKNDKDTDLKAHEADYAYVDGEKDMQTTVQIEEDVNEFDEKQKFIIDLILLYRALPALWDPECPDYTDRMMRNLQYEKLLEKYKEQYPDATKEDVRQKIYSLRSTFRKESKSVSPLEKGTLYYYNAMSFLLKNKRRDDTLAHKQNLNRMQANRIPKGRSPPPESKLNSDQFVILAKIYQSYPNLWDENDIAYRFTNRRRETLAIACQEYKEATGVSLSSDDLEKELLRLRRTCSIEKKQKIYCKRNNTTYVPTCTFYEHITFLEEFVKPFECTFCDQLISGVAQYKQHLSSHDGKLPYQCTICGHGFKLSSNLTVHLRRHVQDYTYICELCQKACATATELKIHMRYHTGEKNYVCDVCGGKFYTASKFNTHMRRHENRPRHRCEICGKGYISRGLYLEHYSTHGEVRDKKCDVCNKGFKNKMQLKQHKRIHDPIKKYLCKICGKRFAQNAGLHGHMKSHGTKLTAKKTGNESENITVIFYNDILENHV